MNVAAPGRRRGRQRFRSYPNVTTRWPSAAKGQRRVPLQEEHREPLEPDQNWFELSELPTIRSFVPLPLRHDVLLRNAEVPPSNEKFRSVSGFHPGLDMWVGKGLWIRVAGQTS